MEDKKQKKKIKYYQPVIVSYKDDQYVLPRIFNDKHHARQFTSRYVDLLKRIKKDKNIGYAFVEVKILKEGK